jgi:threonine dehydrogenase-like Zn-dependent dehydrogenase
MPSAEILNRTVDVTPTDSAYTSVSSDALLQMQGLVYRGPGRRAWEQKPLPMLREPTDAIVHVTTSTICGTDLHILKGDVPTVTEGRILGHEGVGVVTEVGTSVTAFRPGDHVLISCITSCGRCDFCRKQMYSHCRTGVGSLATPSTGPRPTSCASRTRTPVSTQSRQTVMPRLW